jgi:plastocyanin
MRMNLTLLAVSAAAALSFSAARAEPRTVNVYVYSNAFSQNNPASNPPTTLPDNPTIYVGDAIRWVRISGTHNTIAALGQAESWSSGNISSASPYLHTFTHAGDFNYYCSHHGADIGLGLVAGMSGTIHVLPIACSTADVGVQGGTAGQDRILDNNDFIVFINLFFNADAAADMGVQGGGAGHDGLFDNNDFVAFINTFFADQANCTG